MFVNLFSKIRLIQIYHLERSEALEASRLGSLNLDDVESDGLGEGTALTNNDGITLRNAESGRDVSSKSLVTLLVTVVLGEEVEVVTTKDNSALHLVRLDNTLEDTTADRDVGSERALLVNVRTDNSLLGGLEAKANRLVVTNGTVLLGSLEEGVLVKVDASLLLEGLLVLC